MAGDRIGGLTEGRATPFIQVDDSYRSLKTIRDVRTLVDTAVEATVYESQMIRSVDALDAGFNFELHFGGYLTNASGNNKSIMTLYWVEADGTATSLVVLTPVADHPADANVPQPFFLDFRGKVLNSGAAGEIIAQGVMKSVGTVVGGVIVEMGAATAAAGVTVDLSQGGYFRLTADSDKGGGETLTVAISSVVGHIAAKQA